MTLLQLNKFVASNKRIFVNFEDIWEDVVASQRLSRGNGEDYESSLSG
jgi:hypothetical protein